MGSGNLADTNLLVPPLYLTDIVPFFATPAFKSKEFLQAEYVEKRRSCEEIAAEIGSSRTTVLKYLKVHGIAVREIGHNIKRKRGICFGQKILNRKLVFHKSELETIERIRKLREQGYSYWKIADILNALKVKTKTGRGRWHARSVLAVLEHRFN